MDSTRDIDSLVHALYATICGPAGEPRDWDGMRRLFFPNARMIRTSVGEDGAPQAEVMDVETYIARTAPYFKENGFFEWEIVRRIDRFGNVAHVFSTYEARHRQDDAQPFKRGINSIQLFHDGRRWWIVNMLWDNEREDNPLPEEYLPQ